jgi:excisionase family DNA binding protein
MSTVLKDDILISLGKAAAILGVHRDTLRDWDTKGLVEAVRTPGGHRRYRASDIDALLGREVVSTPEQTRALIYGRVSSHDQKKKGDLERQVGRVSAHCAEHGYLVVLILQEVGSGMSDTRAKLQKLFKMVNEHLVDVIVVEHKDRLCRFGSGVLEAYFQSHGVRIEWVKDVLGKSYEEELVQDILSLMTSFCSRIYGRRSAKNRKKAKQGLGK